MKLKNKVKVAALDNDGFVEVNRRRNNSNGEGGETTVDPLKDKEKIQDGNVNGVKSNNKGKVNNEVKKKIGTGSSKVWSLNPENREALRLSAIKFAVLQYEEDMNLKMNFQF
ncbi:hypothetical protein Tco_1023633 [Tanacetum coccineum]